MLADEQALLNDVLDEENAPAEFRLPRDLGDVAEVNRVLAYLGGRAGKSDQLTEAERRFREMNDWVNQLAEIRRVTLWDSRISALEEALHATYALPDGQQAYLERAAEAVRLEDSADAMNQAAASARQKPPLQAVFAEPVRLAHHQLEPEDLPWLAQPGLLARLSGTRG